MALSSSSKVDFNFVCTNYGNNKDGIGHFTSKIVDAIKQEESLKIKVFTAETHNLSKIKLFLSLGMTKQIINLKKSLNKNSKKNYIILEYPFVEYNPLFIIALIYVKLRQGDRSKIVISLHEYARTKILRKLFIRMLIPWSDIVLFTKNEDVKPFFNKKIIFKKRIIPSNIEPNKRKSFNLIKDLSVCFFGIINYETKEIHNMMKGWEKFLIEEQNANRINFHIISSSFNKEINDNERVNYHYNIDDNEVSKLLHNMHYMILPLKPKVSINNGSLAVACVHECIPVGVFDEKYFKKNFGVNMKDYTINEFVNLFKFINASDINSIKHKAKEVYEYGKTRTVSNAAKTYLELINV